MPEEAVASPPVSAPSQQAPTPTAPPVAPAKATPVAPATPSARPAAPAKAPDAPKQHPMSRFKEKLKAAAERGPSKQAVEQAKQEGIDTQAVESDLAKKAQQAADTPQKPDDSAKIAEQNDGGVPKPGEDPAAKAGEPEKSDDEKLGPWQQKQKWEKLARQYEQENTKLKANMAELPNVEAFKERAEKAEARLKEVEDHIKFIDYQQSDEFKTQYEQPYVQAWQRALTEMQELSVSTTEGDSRPATNDDLIHIVQLPLGEARKAAKELFGDSAEDVMAHRRTLRELAGKQQEALDTMKKMGSEKLQQQQQALSTARAESGRLFNEYISSDDTQQPFLMEKEGDDEWNNLLNSKRDWIQKAMSTDSTDPKLTPEQRAQVARDHAHIRGRAIGFSTLKLENTRLRNQIEQQRQEIAQLKSSEPSEGTMPASNGTQQALVGNAMERVRQAIRSKARQSSVPYA